MNTNNVTTPGGQLKKASNGENIDGAIRQFRSTGYLLPRKYPRITVYESMVAISSSEDFLHIPTIQQLKSSFAYIVSTGGAYKPRPLKTKRSKVAKNRRCPLRIAKLVTEEAVKSTYGKNLWCADTVVDLHYYLLVLSVVNPEKYNSVCRTDEIEIAAVRGNKDDENNVKNTNELLKLADSQVAKALQTVDYCKQRSDLSTQMLQMAQEIRSISTRYLKSKPTEVERPSIQAFFSVLHGMCEAHSTWSTSLSAKRRFQKFLDLNSDTLARDHLKDTRNFVAIDPMNDIEDDIAVSDELAQFCKFIAQQPGFVTTDFISLPSLRVPVFDKIEVKKQKEVTVVEALKDTIRNLKSRQLTVEEVENCLKHGWVFADDRRLVHPKAHEGYRPVACFNLEDYYTNTNEGLRQARRIDEGKAFNIPKPVELVRRTTCLLTPQDVNNFNFDDNENVDLLIINQGSAESKAHDSKMQAKAVQFADLLMGPTIELVLDTLKQNYLTPFRANRKPKLLPTLLQLESKIISLADKLWPTTPLGIKAKVTLSKSSKYSGLLNTCRPVKEIGKRVANSIMSNTVNIVSTLFNPWIATVRGEMHIALEEMRQHHEKIPGILYAFQHDIENYNNLKSNVPLNCNRLYSLYSKLADTNLMATFSTVSHVQSSGMTAATNISAAGAEMFNELDNLLVQAANNDLEKFPEIDPKSSRSIKDFFIFVKDNITNLDKQKLIVGFNYAQRIVTDKIKELELGSLSSIIWQPATYLCLKVRVLVVLHAIELMLALFTKMPNDTTTKDIWLKVNQNSIVDTVEQMGETMYNFFEIAGSGKSNSTIDRDQMKKALEYNHKTMSPELRGCREVILRQLYLASITHQRPIRKIENFWVGNKEGGNPTLNKSKIPFVKYSKAIRTEAIRRIIQPANSMYLNNLFDTIEPTCYYEEAIEFDQNHADEGVPSTTIARIDEMGETANFHSIFDNSQEGFEVVQVMYDMCISSTRIASCFKGLDDQIERAAVFLLNKPKG